MAGASTMLMLTIRSRCGIAPAKDLEHMKKQLTLCLQLGTKVSAIWIQASGRAPEAMTATSGSLGLAEQALLDEVFRLMKLVPQPIFGIATGVVSAPAGLVLKACDYVFAESASKFLPAMKTGQGDQEEKRDLWPHPVCIDAQEAEAMGWVNVVLETEMLHNRCQKMIQQISQLRGKKLVELKEIFQGKKLREQFGSKRIPKVVSRSSSKSTELESIAEADEEEDRWSEADSDQILV
eukprot:TRINITY_DN7774_c0_g1_i1.p1 TRINITY_DN7774_c0_g1~~TRINITY_DN7774_c0_g1_i1.p1  ORF type:complete len:237 (-),score=63.80 TRINITY_DN7774_c0_g1_i1:12-722(-)